VRSDGTVVSGNRSGFNYRNVATELGVPWTPFAFVTGNAWDTNFDHGYTVTYMHNPAMRSQAQAVMDAARAANAAGAGDYAVYDFDPRADNTVDETVTALYAMNRWR